jgi:hypothetical protein
MGDFDLDLQTAEGELDEPEPDAGGDVVLGVLDGSTDPEEWISHAENDDVVVLNVDGDLNDLAAGFAREIRDLGGELMHFRGFLIVSPPGRSIETDRLE